MAEPKPIDRLDYTGELEPVVDRLCQIFDIGQSNGFTVIETGYEDCNVIIDTDQDRFIAKMFSKERSREDISRYADVIQTVLEAGVNHPELVHLPTDEIIYTDGNISLVLMRFVEGNTFYELGRLPDEEEFRLILEQAAKINSIDYRPPYLVDSWAIPHMSEMYERVKVFVGSEDLKLVDKVQKRYQNIPIEELPHAFVHGDMIKTNLVKEDSGGIFVLDFSVANWYPRIQELAVMAANLMHEAGGASLEDRCDRIAKVYMEFSPLTELELTHLRDYALAGVVMEFLGSHQEKHIHGNDSPETDYWLDLGRQGLRSALTSI